MLCINLYQYHSGCNYTCMLRLGMQSRDAWGMRSLYHSRLETLLMHITSSRNIGQKPSFTMVKQITYPTQKVEHLLISDRQGKCDHSSSVYLNQQKVSSSIVGHKINPFTSHTTLIYKQLSM